MAFQGGTSSSPTAEFKKIVDNTEDGFNYTATREVYMQELIQVYKNNYKGVEFGEAIEIPSANMVMHLINIIKNPSMEFLKSKAYSILAKSYKVVYERGEDILIRSTPKEEKFVKVLGYEDAFDVLCGTHRNIDHCDKDLLEKLLSDKYEIPSICYKVFSESCNVCQNNQSFNKNVQVSIINIPIPEENFNSILLYKDLWADYHLLRPLCSYSQYEISIELLKIFTDFGIPNMMYVPVSQKILFEASLELMNQFLPCTVVLNTMSDQDSEEDSNKIVNMIKKWMKTSSSGDWAYGCYEVQMELNKTSIYNESNDSPYVKVFGEPNT